MNSLQDTPWPPTIESLTCNDQKMPQSLKLFMDKLLTSPGHDSEIVERLSLSYTKDSIHGVMRKSYHSETFSGWNGVTQRYWTKPANSDAVKIGA